MYSTLGRMGSVIGVGPRNSVWHQMQDVHPRVASYNMDEDDTSYILHTLSSPNLILITCESLKSWEVSRSRIYCDEVIPFEEKFGP